MKQKMAAENKAIQDKLEREAAALKEKMSEENEKRSKESKALQEKLEKEKAALAAQMESGSKELAEKMAKEEELRKQEAAAIKSKLEEEKKSQGNAITEMFDRYKKVSFLRAKRAMLISRKTFGESVLPLVNSFRLFQVLGIYSVK